MRAASALRLASLLLSTSATVILGLQNLNFWAGIGFSLVATAITAIEPYFAWRSRWVVLEEMQYRFYRLEDRVRQHVAFQSVQQITQEWVDKIFTDYTAVWEGASMPWLESRRHGDRA